MATCQFSELVRLFLFCYIHSFILFFHILHIILYSICKNTKSLWSVPKSNIINQVYLNKSRNNELDIHSGGKAPLWVWGTQLHLPKEPWRSRVCYASGPQADRPRYGLQDLQNQETCTNSSDGDAAGGGGGHGDGGGGNPEILT